MRANVDPNIKKAVIRLWNWQYGDRGSFGAILFQLIAKADYINRASIFLGFPYEVKAYLEWSSAEDPEAYLRAWGLSIPGDDLKAAGGAQ